MPSESAPDLLLADGKPASGQTVSATPAGAALTLSVPAGRRLERAVLEIAAASAEEAALSGAGVSTDAGALSDKADARWVSLDWGAEKALVALKIDGKAAGDLRSGMRVKLYSNGNWLPLPPLDTLKLGAEQRFPAIAARRLMAEMLVENVIDAKNTGVLVPGALPVSAAALTATKQPCYVEIAVGDDPPFFTWPGPLPAETVSVSGLARIANRYLADHPAATQIPLRMSAAAPADVRLKSFVATLVALPAPEPSRPTEADGAGSPAPAPPRPETEYLALPQPQAAAARLCDSQHTPAQCFEALPKDALLSSLELYARASAAGVKGRVTMHRDQNGSPGTEPLAESAFDIAPVPTLRPDAGWLKLTLPTPLDLSSGRWWAVCSLAAGELLWYAATDAPKSAGPALYRVGIGPWLPVAAPQPAPWVQVRLRVTAPGA